MQRTPSVPPPTGPVEAINRPWIGHSGRYAAPPTASKPSGIPLTDIIRIQARLMGIEDFEPYLRKHAP